MASSKQILELVTYLKNKYPNNSFYYDYSHSRDNPCSELSYMNLNDFDCRAGTYEDECGILSDIIIIIGNPRKEQDIVKRKVGINLSYYKFASIVTEELVARELKLVKKNFSQIRTDYHLIDMFYLDEPKTENSMVTLLGRKDKFPLFLKNKINSNKNEDNKKIQ